MGAGGPGPLPCKAGAKPPTGPAFGGVGVLQSVGPENRGYEPPQIKLDSQPLNSDVKYLIFRSKI